MTDERATMNAIEHTRQLFDARLETLEAKIDGKLALIFQRLDAMPDRAELTRTVNEAIDPLRKLIIWSAFAATATVLSILLAVRALNIDALGVGFDLAQIIVERDKKHDEEMRALRKMIVDNGRMIVDNANFLRELREQLLQKPAPNHP